jgi:hypothetical protein
MTTRIPPPNNGKDQPGMNPGSDKCREIADALGSAFVWDQSAEGHNFWFAVRDRLRAMARIADRKPDTPPPLPDPPARPSSLAASCDTRDWLAQADGIDVEHHDAGNHNTEEWSLYLLVPFGGRREWFADYEIGTNSDQFTAEEAEALAFEYAERLLEAFPQLRAHGINPKQD